MSSEIIWKYEKPNYEILLEKLEKLQKENTELKEDNSHQWEERCRLTFELERLQEENQELKDINVELNTDVSAWKTTAKELEEENKKLRDTNKILYEMGKQRAIQELLNENWVNKDEIREFIKKELPDDEIMECCSIYDVNGVAIRKELEKILADKE